MNAYTARATREENWWTVTVDEVPGLFAQARRLDQIPAMVQDALALFPEVESNPDQAQINVIPDPTYAKTAATVIELQHASQAAQEKATVAARAAAKDFYHSGLTYRDIGKLLGVSFQHAQKLASAS